MVDDERVTLRLSKDDLAFLDVFVEAGMFPSRSEAIRQAIKDLIASRTEALQVYLANRRKLVESAAAIHNLRQSLEQQKEQLLDIRETAALKKLERR